MWGDFCEVVYWLGQVLVHKEVFEVSVLCKMEVWRRLKDVNVFGYGQILVRRMAEVEEVEEEDGLDEKLLVGLPVWLVDLPVVIVQAMELVKRMMSLMLIMGVVRLFEVVELGQDCWYLPMKKTLEIVGQQLMPG